MNTRDCISSNPLCVNFWKNQNRSHDNEGRLLDTCGACEDAREAEKKREAAHVAR